MARQSQTCRRAHPLRGLALVLALPLAAWSAVDAPHPSASKTDPGAPPQGPTVVAPVPVRVIDARMIATRRNVVRAHAEETLRNIALMTAIARRTAQWDELARCENGGNWNVVDRYGGGLGIYIGTWHAFGGGEFASNPGYATKEQQIAVAERIYERHGLSGWGCKVHMSWR
jgi:Transglycosylase-like domain